MKNIILKISLIGLLVGFVDRTIAQPYSITSPDNSIVVRISEGEQLFYTVLFHGKNIIEQSCLGGFEFKNEPEFGKNLKILNTNVRSNNETWQPAVKSKHAQIRDAYNELTLYVQEQDKSKRLMNITFRVFDDGVAFRYKLFRSENIGSRLLTKECTTFNIPGNPNTWVVEYGSYTSEYGIYASAQEAEFMERKLDYLTDKSIAGLPLLMKQSEDCWIAITEANINNYAGFYIGTTGKTNYLTTKLAPLPGEEADGVKVRFADDLETPWRVIMIGNNPGVLIESEIIQNLNEPCVINDLSWIKPGLSAWDHWWS